jgi:hypothetical protein
MAPLVEDLDFPRNRGLEREAGGLVPTLGATSVQGLPDPRQRRLHFPPDRGLHSFPQTPLRSHRLEDRLDLHQPDREEGETHGQAE